MRTLTDASTVSTGLATASLAALAALLVSGVPGASLTAQAGDSIEVETTGETYLGAPVNVFEGVARTVVRTDGSGEPEALGVQFTPGLLEGLPQERAEDVSLGWHHFLAFPPEAPETGFNHLMLNWHPKGHHPDGIYGVGHFDFHFYLIEWDRQLAIRYPSPMTPDSTGVTGPPDALLPDAYVIPPATHVNEMGLHAVPKDAPELHGEPFVHTFLYGYLDGELAFLEPMITHEFLASRADHVSDVATPERYAKPGWYPTRFRIEYDEEDRVYRVMLEELRRSGEERVAQK